MNNPSEVWSTLVIDQFVKSEVTHFFCCPGMRNAPLLKAISKNKLAHAHAGIDERAQSFRALAFMKAHKVPVALVCTSGTALANFLPAIIEAQKTHLPLMVISADRPGELNATDANQTINQIEVLRDYTKEFWCASEPQSSFAPEALAAKICFLISQALTKPRGPFHLNLPLREPLDHQTAPLEEAWLSSAKAILEQELPQLRIPKTSSVIEDSVITELFSKLEKASRPLIVFGPLGAYDSYKDHQNVVKEFIENYRGSFSFDVTTGLKFEFGSTEGLVPSLDHPEVLAQLEDKEPDLIIHFGHRLTSKHYYGLLARLKAKKRPIVHIAMGAFHEDPGFSFNERWPLNPIDALKAFNKKFNKSTNFSPLVDWQTLIQRKRDLIEEGPLSYPYLTKKAVDLLKGPYQVFIGNSTFIRSFDSYACHESPKAQWHVLTNRGASGIEGHVAMAHGMGLQKKAPYLAFMGDVSFLHDQASLQYFKGDEQALVVIANNQTGGIFNLLPIGSDPEAKDYLPLMTTDHNHDLTKIISAYNIPVKEITTKEQYCEELKKWIAAPSLLFLNTRFSDADNIKIYKELKTLKL